MTRGEELENNLWSDTMSDGCIFQEPGIAGQACANNTTREHFGTPDVDVATQIKLENTPNSQKGRHVPSHTSEQ